MDQLRKADFDAIEYPPIEWNGEYEKVFYWVHLPGGAKVKCWPNAGLMCSVDGSGRHWKAEDRILVSVCNDDPNLRGDDYKERCGEAQKLLEGDAPKPRVIKAYVGGVALHSAVVHAELARQGAQMLDADFMEGSKTPGLQFKSDVRYDFSLSEMKLRIADGMREGFAKMRAYKSPGLTRWSELKRVKRERYLKKKARRS